MGLVGKNFNKKQIPWKGGGVAGGGTLHAGHGHWYSLLTPAVLRPSSFTNKPVKIVRPEDLVSEKRGSSLGSPFKVPYSFGSSARDTGDQPGQRHKIRFEDDVVIYPDPDPVRLSEEEEDYDMVNEFRGAQLNLDRNGHPVYDAEPVLDSPMDHESRIQTNSPLIDNYAELMQHLQRTVGVLAEHPRARMPGGFPRSPVPQIAGTRRRRQDNDVFERNVRPNLGTTLPKVAGSKRKRTNRPDKRNVRRDKKLRINTRGLDASAQGSTGIIPSGVPTGRRENKSRIVTESNIPNRVSRRQ